MATFFNTKNKDFVVLRSQHVFGRHVGSCHTLLSCLEASRLHATVVWNGSRWLLQDNSSNGTFVNGVVIKPGVKQHIKTCDKLQFGSLNADVWQVQNVNPPTPLLILLNDCDQNNGKVIELSGVLALPQCDSGLNSKQVESEERSGGVAEFSFYQSSCGKWLCEGPTGVVELTTGDKITTSVGTWLYVGLDDVESTIPVPEKFNTAQKIKAIFTVSMNEEHVTLTLMDRHGSLDLSERTHHELMLYLARKKLTDKSDGVNETEQGWVDKSILCQETGLSEKHINIHIYRLRQQLIHADSDHMKSLQVVERRRGELRLALSDVDIKGGNDLLKLKA